MKTRNLEDMKVNVKIQLSALWTAVMFLFLYVDHFSLFKPGVIEDILNGVVWEFDITQAWAMGAMVMMTVPSLMIFLSVAMKARANRWVNIIVGMLYIIIVIGNSIGETWAFYILGSVVEFGLLVLVVYYAVKWPREKMSNNQKEN